MAKKIEKIEDIVDVEAVEHPDDIAFMAYSGEAVRNLMALAAVSGNKDLNGKLMEWIETLEKEMLQTFPDVIKWENLAEFLTCRRKEER